MAFKKMKNKKPLNEEIDDILRVYGIPLELKLRVDEIIEKKVEELKKELESIKKSLVLFLRGEGEGECEEAYDKIVRLIKNDKIFGEFK